MPVVIRTIKHMFASAWNSSFMPIKILITSITTPRLKAIDPGMLNAHHKLEILSPIIESANYVVVILTSPTGITESITLQAA
ncbi:MAG: hypothetical protein OTJ43_03240 [Dehalococcoidia bacterium]|nr:hypothetical protein [Dehalococcoidia bacterium]